MPESFDIASRPVAGGFFLVKQGPATPSGQPADVFPSPSDLGVQPGLSKRVVWTRKGEPSTLKEALLAMIRGAKRKIFIASFRIGDEELFEELFRAVERLRGSVYVITMVDEKSLTKGIAEADDDDGADAQALNKQFVPLVERGIYVRGHDSCHAKFVVVDDEIALISSANLETRALSETTEIGVVVRDPGEVNRTARFFAQLWIECAWEVAPSTTYTVAKRTKTSARSPSIPEPATREQAIWTHHQAHIILGAIHEAIRMARRDLLLASFSLMEMASHRDLLLSEVERFRKETGGRVRLLVRARNNIASHRRDAEHFASLGCLVVADGLNHAKCVIADDKEAVLFSANFDAQHGLTSGVEAGMRLVEPSLVRRATAFFDRLVIAAPMSLVRSPSHADLQRLAIGWARPWPEKATVRVRAPDAAWQALVRLEAGRPVLFEQGTDGRLVLIAGRCALFLQRGPGENESSLGLGPSDGVDSGRVFEEWLSVRQPAQGQRGLCAATFVRV